MILKAVLKKPCTVEDKLSFKILNNQKFGYLIKETDTEIQAWGYSKEEKQEQLRKYKNSIELSRDLVFEGLILARLVDKNKIKEIILNNNYKNEAYKLLLLNSLENSLFFKRGSDIIDEIGNLLNITQEALDNFFETGNYRFLQ